MAKDGTAETADYNPTDTGNTLGTALDGYAEQVESGTTPVYGNDLYAGMGQNTNQALYDMHAASLNPDYASGVSGAMSDYANVAAGNAYGTDDPGYARLRQDTIDDTMTAVGSTFTNSGRFGSGAHTESAGKGVGSAVAALDYSNYLNDQQRQDNAVGMLSTLYDQALAPSETLLQIGQTQDADAQAALAADYDLWNRTENADYDRLTELIALFGGSQDSAGMEEDADFFDYLSTFSNFL